MKAWPRCTCGGPAAPVGAPALVVTFEVDTKSEANARGFWAATNRKKKQDKALEEALAVALPTQPLPPGPWLVRLTRISPKLLDDDNLGSAFKRLRDQMAKVLGVDDRSPSVAFVVAQEKRAGDASVRVEVWGAAATTKIAGIWLDTTGLHLELEPVAAKRTRKAVPR